MVPFSKSPIYISNFPWKQTHVNIQITQKFYNWSGTCFLAQITRKLGSGIISMKRRLKWISFLSKYSVNNKALNYFTTLYIWTI
jgi:hypothetical protein